MQRCVVHRSMKNANSQSREQTNSARMVVSPLWRGAGKSYRQGEATAQTPLELAVSGVILTT